ncbi:M48 family metallopeptidase [Longispora sp. K20-0274]|uniref:M48 family metallopeptidase n=1 Tax=Longispora sp. K20-0274 TaxID=3088255 RepID=UPI00399B4BF9
MSETSVVRGPIPRPRRHPWEIPMVVLGVLVSVTVMVVVFVLLVSGARVDEELAATVVALPFLIYLVRGRTYATQRVNGVRITPEQFPDAHAIIVDAARAMGLAKVPDAYVVLGNGVINAFASGHGFRRYLAFHSDLFEVGGRLGDPDTFAFIAGHELGHIRAGHVSYWRQVGTALMNTVPAAGATLSRSQEYTADNHGYAVCPQGHRGMTVLAAGKYLYPQVDFDAMADRGATDRGFFVFLVNLLSSHPVNIKRFAALRDRSRPGRMFF